MAWRRNEVKFENGVCKMIAILSMSHCVNPLPTGKWLDQMIYKCMFIAGIKSIDTEHALRYVHVDISIGVVSGSVQSGNTQLLAQQD